MGLAGWTQKPHKDRKVSSSPSDLSRIHRFLGVTSMKLILLTKNSSLDTFGKLPFTPYVLSASTIKSDKMQKYLVIYVCTFYCKVGRSPRLIYYKLLVK